MKYPVSISKWRICNCGKGDWKIIKVQVDDKFKERFNTILTRREQKSILNLYKQRGMKMSMKQYILTMQCKECSFCIYQAVIIYDQFQGIQNILNVIGLHNITSKPGGCIHYNKRVMFYLKVSKRLRGGQTGRPPPLHCRRRAVTIDLYILNSFDLYKLIP